MNIQLILAISGGNSFFLGGGNSKKSGISSVNFSNSKFSKKGLIKKIGQITWLFYLNPNIVVFCFIIFSFFYYIVGDRPSQYLVSFLSCLIRIKIFIKEKFLKQKNICKRIKETIKLSYFNWKTQRFGRRSDHLQVFKYL